MRVDLDTGKYNVVISSSNFDVSIESGAKLDVNIGKSARIDVNSAVTYIKSGKKEIDTYVDGKVKPDILEYSKVESQKFIDSYVGSTVEEYVDEVTIPSITEFSDSKIREFNSNAVSKTDDFNTLSETLTGEYQSLAQSSEESLVQYINSANTSASNASKSEINAKASETNVSQYEKNAKSYSDNATSKSQVATQQAEIATSKASEALSSANRSEQSAKNSSDSSEVALGYATSAGQSASSASLSASNASKSESNAKTSETNAKASETLASQHSSSALQSATSASNSATTATNKAKEAGDYAIECASIKESLGVVYTFRGSVATVSALPSGAKIGDVYDVQESGINYAWTGTEWDALGSNVDLSIYAKKTDLNTKQDKLTAGTGIKIENNVVSNTQTSANWGNITGTLSNQTDLQNAFNKKQNTLVSGTNIKTINGESMLGGGNVEVISDVSYEDLDEDVTINPTPIREEWQTFQNTINNIINSLEVELNKVKSVRYVVEKYENGTDWYTLYSDGWCEQGGRSALNETSTTTVTLHKAYKNTNYSVCAVSITESTVGDTECGLQCTPKTTSTITLTAHYLNPNNQNACWETKGYIS